MAGRLLAGDVGLVLSSSGPWALIVGAGGLLGWAYCHELALWHDGRGLCPEAGP